MARNGSVDVGDPSQLIPPDVDTEMEFKGLKTSDLKYGVPGGAMLAGAGFAWTIQIPGAIPLSALGVPLSMLGPAASRSTDDSTTLLDRGRSPIRYLRQRHGYPKSTEDASDIPIHGVSRVREDGTALMEDGRLCALVRVHGRNTDKLSGEEMQTIISGLATRIDDRIDFDFRYFSTTTEYDPSDVTAKYRQAAYEEWTGDEWRDARELLYDVAEWYERVETERWEAKNWCHYIVVPISRREVDSDAMSLTHSVPFLGGDDGDAWQQHVERMSVELGKRVDTVEQVFGAVEGVETHVASPEETALIHAQYWSGVDRDFSHLDEIRDGRLEQLLSAPRYDLDETMEAGEQYVRTFWVAEWPQEPDPGFLRNLTTMQRVDVDVTLHVKQRDKDEAQHYLEHEIADLDADIDIREEKTDVSAITASDDMKTIVKAYKTLYHTDARPWDVNGYITVRAGTRDALDRAEEKIREGTVDEEDVTVDIQRRKALEDDSEKVQDVATSAPVKLSLLSPRTRQEDLFRSCSPTGADAYASVSHRDRDTMALGGAVAAMFPALSREIRHKDGIEWGRQKLDGSEVVADPFDGGVGHALFIGGTGSGKTYSTLQKLLRWYLSDPSRTIVLCDTFGDFEGITEMLNGDHVVLGGEQTINPLHIEETPDHVRDSGVDPYAMKIDSVTAFVTGILREQGVDPGQYVTLIKDVAHKTYEIAGILPDDVDTHSRESPTMHDYLDVLTVIAEDPDTISLSEAESERSEIEANAGKLLRKLSGFQDGREYDHLAGESEASVDPGGVTYLDLQQMEQQGEVGKSVMLQLMLDKVYQSVKRTPGETLFLIDEAHYLLHNEETVQWLQRASRHWRHYNAGVWFASQSPAEFVSSHADADEHKNTIRAQASTVQFTRTKDLDDSDAEKFGMNEKQADCVQNKATKGSEGAGYSEALINFDSVEGWVRTEIRASEMEDTVLSYDPDSERYSGIEEYLNDVWYDGRDAGRDDSGSERSGNVEEVTA